MLIRQVNMVAYNAVFQCMRGTRQRGANLPSLTTVRCNSVDYEHYPGRNTAFAKPFESIPHFRIVPVLGTSWTYLPIIGRYTLEKQHLAGKDKQRRLGNIFREKAGSLDIVVTTNTEDGHILFRNEGRNPSRGGLTSLKLYRESRKEWYKTPGVLVLQGQEWRDLRSKLGRFLIQSMDVQACLDPVQDVARDFIDKIYGIRDEKNEVPNFLDELYKWALESIAFFAMDTRLGCLDLYLSPDSDAMQMIQAVQTKFECINAFEAVGGSLLPLWKYFPTPKWRKFAAAADVFTGIAFKHISRAFTEAKKTTNEKRTLLQSMLLSEELSPAEAMVTVADLVMGGIDTTAHMIGFFLYHMARNPEKQELVHSEISRLLPKKEDRITAAITNEFRYLSACIKETQRLNPVFPGIARSLEHDIVLSGYRVPAKVLIVFGAQIMSTDERYYPDPQAFKPERWLNKDVRVPLYAFLPFGNGSRSCLGRRVANLETLCLLTEMIRHFRVEYRYEDIDMFSRLVNTPDKPLRFNFIERQR